MRRPICLHSLRYASRVDRHGGHAGRPGGSAGRRSARDPATVHAGQQLDRPPEPPEVTLQFSEAVETAFGSIRVYDCGGSRVDSGKIIRPSESSVAVEIGRRLPAGTYTVTWRVISADAHPVAGAFVFHVKSATKGAECKIVFGEGTPGSVDALFKFMRALDFALLLLVVGGAAALALILRTAAFELALACTGSWRGSRSGS